MKITVVIILQGWSAVMQMLQTQLSDTVQKVNQFESQLLKLREEKNKIEVQLHSVQVGYVKGVLLFISASGKLNTVH